MILGPCTSLHPDNCAVHHRSGCQLPDGQKLLWGVTVIITCFCRPKTFHVTPGEYVYYTDGSAINEKVGSTHTFTLRLFLGAASFYTVYSAELAGIMGALHLALARSLSINCRRVIIFTDNQAAIHALDNPERQSGQIMITDIVQIVELLRSKNIQIELHWVPAHSELDGNEKADKPAKESTGWRLKKRRNNRSVEEDTNRTAPKVFIPPLKAAIKAVHKQQIDSKWAESWAAESKGKELQALAPTPGLRFYSYTKGLRSQKLLLLHK